MAPTLLALLTLLLTLAAIPACAFDRFITRDGATLRDGDNSYRFISVNIPNYFIVEDRATAGGAAWHRVTEFEQRDAAAAVNRLGGQVLRSYTFSVEGGRNVQGKLAHIYNDKGRIRYNEELFRDVDRGLAIAAEQNVRVIIPLVDNWEWFGGHAEWARLAKANDFWDDPRARTAFKQFIVWLLNRKNTVTGKRYKDDPTILAWELGNEIDKASASWITEMAAFMKQHDKKHLLIDGGHKQLVDAALRDPHIDIVTTHYTDDTFDAFAQRAAAMGKAYLYGEFSPAGGPEAVRAITERTIASPAAGSLAWSLRFRSASGGFYYHSDFNNQSDSLHYPGFDTTLPHREREIFDVLRHSAFAIQGRSAPTEAVPDAPVLLPIQHPSAINWQGSAGATGYAVQRRQGNGEWVTLAEEISDAMPQAAPDNGIISLLPLFSDRPGSGRWSYRVIARNAAGNSPPSNSIEVTITE
jgi:hypothetical protein